MCILPWTIFFVKIPQNEIPFNTQKTAVKSSRFSFLLFSIQPHGMNCIFIRHAGFRTGADGTVIKNGIQFGGSCKLIISGTNRTEFFYYQVSYIFLKRALSLPIVHRFYFFKSLSGNSRIDTHQIGNTGLVRLVIVDMRH